VVSVVMVVESCVVDRLESFRVVVVSVVVVVRVRVSISEGVKEEES